MTILRTKAPDKRLEDVVRDMDSGVLTEGKLRTLYHDREMSIPDIAEETGEYEFVVWQRMDELEIDRRDAHPDKNTEPNIQTYPNGYSYLVHHDGEEKQVIPMHRLNVLASRPLGDLDGKHVHHINRIGWLNHPANLEVLTPSEHGERHSPEPEQQEKQWRYYATRQHFIVEELMNCAPTVAKRGRGE